MKHAFYFIPRGSKGSICEHGCSRYYCKDCGGEGMCHRGRQKYYCNECDGVCCLTENLKTYIYNSF